MIGRTPGYIVAVRPLRGGAITDFEITQRLIRMLFQRAGISRLQRARVNAALIGESIVTADDPAAKIRELLG